MLDRLGEGAAAWLDRGTEHPHRIALSIRGDCLGDAVEQLRAGFEAASVQARTKLEPMAAAVQLQTYNRQGIVRVCSKYIVTWGHCFRTGEAHANLRSVYIRGASHTWHAC